MQANENLRKKEKRICLAIFNQIENKFKSVLPI
jgi:hypothetical protein